MNHESLAAQRRQLIMIHRERKRKNLRVPMKKKLRLDFNESRACFRWKLFFFLSLAFDGRRWRWLKKKDFKMGQSNKARCWMFAFTSHRTLWLCLTCKLAECVIAKRLVLVWVAQNSSDFCMQRRGKVLRFSPGAMVPMMMQTTFWILLKFHEAINQVSSPENNKLKLRNPTTRIRNGKEVNRLGEDSLI